MIPAVKCRRGMTLAELMVSLAMVAIMIVMVVSFSMLLTDRTRSSGENLSFQQDFAAVKAGVEGWMANTAGQTLTADENAVKAGENTLQFQNGVLSAGDIDIRTETVRAVTFHLAEENGEYLLFCTVMRAESEDSYTFCVNPRVGEMVGAS